MNSVSVEVASIDALLTQSGVLPFQQIEHEGWVLKDQREKTGTVQTEQKQGRQGFGITAVEFTGLHQILIEEQLSRAIANAIARSTDQFNQSPLRHMDSLNWLTSPKHQSTCRKCQPIAFRMLGDQLKRCCFAAQSLGLQYRHLINHPI